MDFGFNWVDLIIIATFCLFTLESFGKPLLSELSDFISFLLAFFLSFRYYNLIGKLFEVQFDIPHGLALVLGFMSIWFFAETLLFALARIIFPRVPHLKIIGEGYLAMIPGFLRGVIFISLFLVLLATFPIQPAIKKSVIDSKIGSFLLKRAYAFEEPVKNVFGGVTNDTLTFLTIKPKTDETVDLGFQTEDYKLDEQTENLMIDLVNKERASRGLKTLKIDVNLRSVARSHSEDMFKRGYFSHYSPERETVADRAEKMGIDFLVIGENLAYAPNLELAHKGLMNSEGHRANILSEDFGKIGIGVIDGGIYGKMFTQVFSN